MKNIRKKVIEAKFFLTNKIKSPCEVGLLTGS